MAVIRVINWNCDIKAYPLSLALLYVYNPTLAEICNPIQQFISKHQIHVTSMQINHYDQRPNWYTTDHPSHSNDSIDCRITQYMLNINL